MWACHSGWLATTWSAPSWNRWAWAARCQCSTPPMRHSKATRADESPASGRPREVGFGAGPEHRGDLHDNVAQAVRDAEHHRERQLLAGEHIHCGHADAVRGVVHLLQLLAAA